MNLSKSCKSHRSCRLPRRTEASSPAQLSERTVQCVTPRYAEACSAVNRRGAICSAGRGLLDRAARPAPFPCDLWLAILEAAPRWDNRWGHDLMPPRRHFAKLTHVELPEEVVNARPSQAGG